MGEDLSSILISKIRNFIPDNIKITSYLMDLLDISRESAYRRTRGQIPFTLDEVYLLSEDMGVSIDELVGKEPEENLFSGIKLNEEFDSTKSFRDTLIQYRDETLKISSSSRDAIIAANRIPLIFVLARPYLLKFYYYMWLYQTGNVPLNYGYSDIIMPDEMTSIAEEADYMGNRGNLTTIILDANYALNTIKEIQYYYKRKLISETELAALKKELSDYGNMAETLTQKGENEFGTRHQIYLSSFDIDSNSANWEYPKGMISTFNVYPVNPIVIRNKHICLVHRHWLNSLKRFSTLISGSNEIAQAEFYAQQFDYVENIDKIMY